MSCHLWHYTVGERLVKIVESGYIQPATAFITSGEKGIVWFTFSQSWEPTANKMWCNPDGTLTALNERQTAELGGGLVRISVDPAIAPYNWHALQELSGMPSRHANELYRSAVKLGSKPNDWRGTFDAVPRSVWTGVEVFHEGNWTSGPPL